MMSKTKAERFEDLFVRTLAPWRDPWRPWRARPVVERLKNGDGDGSKWIAFDQEKIVVYYGLSMKNGGLLWLKHEHLWFTMV